MCFFIPLIISLVSGTKHYCNRCCGRGQLLALLGGRFGLSRKRDIPRWMKSNAFRYGFLAFFPSDVPANALEHLSGVRRRAGGNSAGRHAAVDLQAPWHWAYHGTLLAGVARLTLVLQRSAPAYHGAGPCRPWSCSSPAAGASTAIGSMTQLICKAKSRALSAPGQQYQMNGRTADAVRPFSQFFRAVPWGRGCVRPGRDERRDCGIGKVDRRAAAGRPSRWCPPPPCQAQAEPDRGGLAVDRAIATHAMMAEIVSAGGTPGTTIMSSPTEQTQVMASSLSRHSVPASARSCPRPR